MYVVLDTSVLRDDWHLRRTAVRALLAASTRGDHRVVVPELVVAEFVNRFRERLQSWDKAIDDHAAALGDMGVDAAAQTLSEIEIDVQATVSEYENGLRRTLAASRVFVPELPAVSHAELIQRDLARCKPFDQKGRGYRDALIWHTILELPANATVALLSANRRDFGSEDGTTLHAELADERPSELFPSIESFVANEIAPIEDALARLNSLVAADASFNENLLTRVSYLARVAQPLVTQRDEQEEVIGWLKVQRLVDPKQVLGFTGGYNLGDGKLGVFLEVEADAELELETRPIPMPTRIRRTGIDTSTYERFYWASTR